MKARAGLGLGVIAALAIAIWAAVSRGNGDPPPTTVSTTTVATTATTTSTTIASTTSTTAATTTTPAETTVDPEARVEEVRQILQDLYYGWFLAIYNQDEETVRTIIADIDSRVRTMLTELVPDIRLAPSVLGPAV